MLKNVSRLEISVNGKSHQFTCDMDAPLTDVKEALFQFQKYIGQIEDNIRQQQEAEKQALEHNVKDDSKIEAIPTSG